MLIIVCLLLGVKNRGRLVNNSLRRLEHWGLSLLIVHEIWRRKSLLLLLIYEGRGVGIYRHIELRVRLERRLNKVLLRIWLRILLRLKHLWWGGNWLLELRRRLYILHRVIDNWNVELGRLSLHWWLELRWCRVNWSVELGRHNLRCLLSLHRLRLLLWRS